MTSSLLQLLALFILVSMFLFAIMVLRPFWLYSIRFISFRFLISLGGTTLILWVNHRQLWMAILGLTFTLWNCVYILSWPVTQKKLMKRIGLRW